MNHSAGPRNRLASSATVVRVEKRKVVVALPSRKEITLDLLRTDSFDVARSRQIEVAPGDKVLIRANDKRLGLINGQVLTICSITSDGTLQTKEACVFPRSFDNGATDMSSLLTRPKDGLRIMLSLLRSGSPPKESTWRVPEADGPASYIPRQDSPDGTAA